MKFKLLLLSSVFLMNQTTKAQIFTDNFDSYTAGSYLGPQSSGAWTTWSNAPGTNEDVLVSSADAVSAPNSLRFVSNTQTGGPTDLVRNFGVLNTGSFELKFKMKVANGAAGYFNLQKNATIGQVWAMDANFNDDGTLTIINQSGLNFSTTYSQGTWFEFKLAINFNTNNWEVFIDNVSKGSFANPVNQIASIDIYPVDQNAPYNADYFIDDFSTTISPYTLTPLNGAVTYAAIQGGLIAGNVVKPSFKVRNLGVNQITSFDINVNYNGNSFNQSYTGLTLNSLAEQSFTTTNNITLASGNLPMTITISNVNGNANDGDVNDDVKIKSLNPVVPAPGKMVVSEEATGTWCGWCPRGTVAMDHFNNLYSNFWAGIAVHNGASDPMKIAEYDTPMSALVGGSYPSAVVDRTNVIDPSEMEPDFFTRLQLAPKAFIINGANWNSTTRELKVSVTANFQAAANNNYKLACVLTQDSVKGTSGYAQTNYYSSSSQNIDLIDDNGVNWKNLPNPVPSASMRYDHVARAIAPSFDGEPNSFPSVVNNGDSHTLNFTFTLPASWNENKMHIIGLLIDPNGKIDNAGKATIPEAVANGFVNGGTSSVSEILPQIDDQVQIFPNPANNVVTIKIDVNQTTETKIELVNLQGKLLAEKTFGQIENTSIINLPIEVLESGSYIMNIYLNQEKISKGFVVQH